MCSEKERGRGMDEASPLFFFLTSWLVLFFFARGPVLLFCSSFFRGGGLVSICQEVKLEGSVRDCKRVSRREVTE